ncbi:MAG: putative lipid II flippase FtsW [Euzebyaceae bacterium]|jgi:cell division protein FtsW|nr:putative lipid II flippase FtsW [Euzebyaceae bacterium]
MASDVARRRWSGTEAVRWTRATVAGESTLEFRALVATTAVLWLLGLIMTFSASFVASTAESGNAFGIFARQLLWNLLGLPLMVVAARCDYRRWRHLAIPLLVVSLVAAAAVAIPGVGIVVNGARRWLGVGPLRFQPSELLKLAVPLYLAHVLARRWRVLRRGDLRALLLPAVPLLGLVGLLVMLEPDLETAVLIACIGGVTLVAAGLPVRIVGAGVALLGVLAAVGIATSDYRRGRFMAWLNPMSDPAHYGYQTVQGYLALGSGGWTGTGLGQGRGKWLYIPNAHTDYIFAIIGEELGLVGSLGVLLLFVLLAVFGLRTARRAPDPFGRLLAVSLTGWLLLQAVINIGSVVGLLPVTGVTLPLVSFGGSSLVVTALGLGILLAIARAGEPRAAGASAIQAGAGSAHASKVGAIKAGAIQVGAAKAKRVRRT